MQRPLTCSIHNQLILGQQTVLKKCKRTRGRKEKHWTELEDMRGYVRNSPSKAHGDLEARQRLKTGSARPFSPPFSSIFPLLLFSTTVVSL